MHGGLWYVSECDPEEMPIDDCVWIVFSDGCVTRGFPSATRSTRRRHQKVYVFARELAPGRMNWHRVGQPASRRPEGTKKAP